MFGLIQGEANAIAPHKRPLSSMTPTIVLEEVTAGSNHNGVKREEPLGPAEIAAGATASPLVATPTTVVPSSGAQQAHLVLGASGGGTIINAVLEVVLNVLVSHMDVREAVTAPRFHHQWMPDKLVMEARGFSADTEEKLKTAGYTIETAARIGECQAIAIDVRSGWRFGAADPRGYGKAAGF